MNPKLIQYQKHIFFTIYILIGIVANYFHEPWRDETQAYLIAFDSQNLIDLYRNTRYEGHPMAWFLILFFVKLINSNYVLVKILHFLIATASVYLLLFRSNINSLWKILIPFGYYFLFEYNIICRNYAIGILFLFLSLYHIERKNWIYVALFTVAAFQSNVYILLISFSLWLTILSIHFREYKLKFSYLTAIVFLGLFITYKITYPPADSGFASNTNFDCFNYLRTIDKLSQAYIVVPKLVVNFWNSTRIGHIETTIVGVILLIFLISYFRNFKKVYPFFIFASLSIFAFMNVKYWGFLRHFGHLYIIFIAAIWLKSIYYPDIKIRFSKFYYLIITAIFLTQIFSASVALYYDFKYEFSQGKSCGEYILSHDYKNHTLIARTDFTATTVASIIHRPIFYENSNRFGSFVIWDSKRYSSCESDSCLSIVEKQFYPKKLLLINNSPVQNSRFKLIKEFSPSICDDEKLFLYESK